MYWVKDKRRLEEPIEFSNTHNEVEVTLRAEIEAVHERVLCIKEQNRKGEPMITDDFQFKLESAIQWEHWVIELNRHLEMIIGANDIALSYVIREYTILDHSKQTTWEEKTCLAAPQTGNRYMIDKLVMHNIITRNISETSHAYTYINTRIRNNNGRVDI